MSEVKMVMPDRVKLTVSDKKGNKFVSLGIEQDIPEGIDVEVAAEALFNKAAGIVKAKMALFPEPEEKKSFSSNTSTQQARKDSGSDYGNCEKCGAPNKWSFKKSKPYCGAMCWKS